MAEIAFEAVCLAKWYGAVRGVEDLSFAIERGEIFGYLGPNGSGKTTTLRCAMGLIKPTSGGIRVLGERVAAGRATGHGRIGYLPGDFRLWPQLTACRALEALGAIGGGGRAKARRNELAQRLGLDLDRRVGDLSRGNRQKIGLVLAFQHDPDLLILDEPTTGLDPLVRQTAMDLMREAAGRGACVLLSSHNLTEVAAVCHRAAILREGRLVELAPVARIVEQGEHQLEIGFAPGAAVCVDSLLRAPGVRLIRADEGTVHLAYRGAPDAVLKWAAQYPVDRIDTPQASLEKAFIQYYSGDIGAREQPPAARQRPPTAPKEPGPADRRRGGGPHPPFPFPLLRFWAGRLLGGWALIALMISIVQIAVCGVMHDNQSVQAFLAFVQFLPAALRDVVGGDLLSSGNVTFLVSIGYQHPLVLVLIMLYAVAAPTGLLTGEAQRGTMELILGRPATRAQVYGCAALCTLPALFALALMMFVGTVAGTRIFHFAQPMPLAVFLRVAMNWGLLACAAGGLGLLAAASFRQRGPAVGVTAGFLIVNYFLHGFAKLWPLLRAAGPWTLFHYVDPERVFRLGGLPWDHMAVLGGVMAGAAVVGGVVWGRRDLAL